MKKLSPEVKAQLLSLAIECLEIVKSLRVDALIMSVEVSCLKSDLQTIKAA